MPESPEGLDLESLRAFFAAKVPGARDAALHASLISGGRSNLTYRMSDGEHTWVLRRPPLGHVLPTAHDMVREYRVISALAPTDVPVPRTDALCTDTDVIGAPFYVMEYVDGVILRDPAAVTALDSASLARCSAALVDVLATIHSVDPAEVGLRDFGRPQGYLERQVRRWGEQWERSKTRELPSIDDVARRLRAALPTSGPPAIVHGDYRLDNTILDPHDAGRIIAVLDWEMSTLGDPLTDLGLFLLYWGGADAQTVATGSVMPPAEGLFTRQEIIDRYAERSGRSVTELDWYEVFAGYKLAIIVEGIHARFQMGKTLGDGFEHMGEIVSGLADGALERARQSSVPALRT